MRKFKPASTQRRRAATRITDDPHCAITACREDRQMELAALVIFVSIALWFVEEVFDI